MIIAREAAREQGLKRYFTGTPCKRGHLSDRMTGSGHCYECQKLVADRWRKENPDKIRSAWRGIAARMRDNHGDRIRDTARQRYATDATVRDARKASAAKWRRENPAARKAQHQRRRSAKKSAEGSFTAADIERIRKQQKGKCACCKKRRKLTIDHIIALSKGGSNYPSNIQLLCMSCNVAKRDSDPIEHMQSLGRLL